MTDYTLSHLKQLEAESIHIIREVAAEFRNPVMLYSVGKDSGVMLRLAEKAFAPAKIPFPLLHVNTTFKFKEMIQFRDWITGEIGANLIERINPDGKDGNSITPWSHGVQDYTRMMKTDTLKMALSEGGYDAAFGGARRDEEKSRAKERVFSFRDRHHQWDPKNQRPELWNIYNTRVKPGESIRVFPMSNWTELDVWLYIWKENIPVVPLYLAKERPVIERNGALIMPDDDRLPLEPGEKPVMKSIRFRTLGCYPLTGAVESTADTIPAVVEEMLRAKESERQGRVIDFADGGSMEEKKKEGYF